MASSGAGTGSGTGGGSERRDRSWATSAASAPSTDIRTMFLLLHSVTEDNIRFFRQNSSETSRRFVTAFSQIQEHGRHLQPLVQNFTRIFPIFDFDEQTPANGYRSLIKVVRSCILHIIHKSRYITSNRRSIFFRTNHNCMEIEAYCSALCQLRALVYFAQRLLTANKHGDLFFGEEKGLSEDFLHESNSMHKGCFYGRCLGFQFTPAIRPFLQTISIGLVSFGENYRKHDTGLGVAATSIFTSGKYAIDPELRGSEFERLTQNLDVHFWKSFWNITETEVLASLVTLTSTTVRVNKTLSVPPNPFKMPMQADPSLMVDISPPVAHSGPGPVQMRLISYELRDGQDSDELNELCKPEAQLGLDIRLKTKKAPQSKFLIVHFHGGGFVAQTSKSHEAYLKSWAHELDSPILSVDYSLAPEAPFPRALEECFFAYCWAINNCHLLGSSGERICLAGDSAGGNLCLTVSMRAASYGIRMPDGIMAAYPATLLQASASPSRLLTFIDPLLPLSVLSKCLSAYAGTEAASGSPRNMEKTDTLSLIRNDAAALLLRDIRLGASAWLNSLMDSGKSSNKPGLQLWACLRRPLTLLVQLLRLEKPNISHCPVSEAVRKSCSEAALTSTSTNSSSDLEPTFVMSRTCEEPGDSSPSSSTLSLSDHLPNSQVQAGSGPRAAFYQEEEGAEEEEEGGERRAWRTQFPGGFQPLRSEAAAASIKLQTSAIVRNPFMSPLLATDDMLRGLPPVHLVACALDPMLDDSVMFAKRLRSVGQPVSLQVVEDLPHGFLSLSHLSRETKEASSICVDRIREVLQGRAAASQARKHRKLERLVAKAPSAVEVRQTADLTMASDTEIGA
ncbi:hormone-sensitive lipase isoform X2 [Stegostoma tigrinum]|uniref:hormone-sensitive lipase isoform X2 n=1 Tax=Stegostoma tigrinum TaxID=3053191 RepID=UPI0028705FD9|nr:hormone-sensitive lipase isoform X2 [Stegostoma tigrinum]